MLSGIRRGVDGKWLMGQLNSSRCEKKSNQIMNELHVIVTTTLDKNNVQLQSEHVLITGV